MTSDPLILVVNAGSSSLKLTVFVGDCVSLRATVERTNQTAVERRFWIKDRDGKEVLCGTLPSAEHSTLLQVVLDTVVKQ